MWYPTLMSCPPGGFTDAQDVSRGSALMPREDDLTAHSARSPWSFEAFGTVTQSSSLLNSPWKAAWSRRDLGPELAGSWRWGVALGSCVAWSHCPPCADRRRSSPRRDGAWVQAELEMRVAWDSARLTAALRQAHPCLP